MSNLAETITPQADFPEKLAPLFEPYRYKILYGGRGGAKSWGIARALLIMGAERPLRILCARELQKSIKDSVHRLLSDQIGVLELDSFYDTTQNVIRGQNGTEFFFEGLKHNSQQIKSYEGIDIAWVEEAVTVSKASWDFLIPTIRKEGSEIWVSFNPELEEDETYKRFVTRTPTNSIAIKMNWRDNPWFTSVLEQEKDDLKRDEPEDYETVWEGQCRAAVAGAIYAKEMRKAMDDDRIRAVPYDASHAVQTFWDLGWADNTSIWFVQKIGFEYRIIDFYQNARQSIQHYLQILQDKAYLYDIDYLPHDAKATQLGSGKSIEELLKNHGRKVEIVPKLSIVDGINAVRTIFPACYFDAEKCVDGLQALRRYRYKVNPETGRESKDPEHDIYSHASDAFRYFAVGYQDKIKPTPGRGPVAPSAHGWMGG